MSLPKQLKSARMTNDTLGIDIDNRVADIEQALCDILGFTVDVDVTESPFSCDNSGRLTKALMRLKAAGPVGFRVYNSTNSKEFRLVLDGTDVKIDENTGTEGTPTWTNRATMILATGVWTFAGASFTAIPTGPAADPTTDNQLARKKYVNDQDALNEKVANKGAASGYCALDAGSKVPTVNLGGAGADVTKVLRGDQSWVTIPSVGKVLQVVNAQTGEMAYGSGIMYLDDTIPQNTEGDQYLSVAITPHNVNNKLLVEVILNYSVSSGDTIIAALFKDSVADALAAATDLPAQTSSYMYQMCLFAYITAGTVSAMTLKVRAGIVGGSGTFTLNGKSGSRQLGGVLVSSITVTEIEV